MNDENVVKVLQESREVVSRCLLLLDSEPGYIPIVSVQKDRLKLLRGEIDVAITYLGTDRSISCTACGNELTKNSEAYCAVCAPKADPAYKPVVCTTCARELTSDNDVYCGDCREYQ